MRAVGKRFVNATYKYKNFAHHFRVSLHYGFVASARSIQYLSNSIPVFISIHHEFPVFIMSIVFICTV